MPKVSLVIPVHGEAEFIGQTLDSVSEALSAPNELVLVLDRLDNDAWIKVEDWLHSSINWIVATSMKPGLASALNVGVAAAGGEYIARLDSDDLLIPGRLRKQANFLDKHPKHIAVGGQMRIFGQVKGKRRITSLPTFNWQIRAEMRILNPMAHPAMMYRHNSLLEVGGYDELIRFGQDYELLHRLSQLGKLRNLHSVVTAYRIHQKQISTSNWAERLPHVVNVILRINDHKLSRADCSQIALAFADPESPVLAKLRGLLLYARRLPMDFVQLVLSKGFSMFLAVAFSWKLQ